MASKEQLELIRKAVIENIKGMSFKPILENEDYYEIEEAYRNNEIDPDDFYGVINDIVNTLEKS